MSRVWIAGHNNSSANELMLMPLIVHINGINYMNNSIHDYLQVVTENVNNC